VLLPIRLRPLLAAVAPPLCWSCGAVAPAREPLCRACRARLRFLDPEPVALAGLPLWAPVAYEGPARDLVRGLKYRGAAGLADALATQIVAGLPAPWKEGSVLVPVPTARSRVRRRGYDQAQLLAAALARRTGLRVERCLVRRRGDAPQVGRGRSARRASLAGSFALRTGHAPGRVLLVDDVVTTGATLAACAETMHAVGCLDLTALAYARTLAR
jgi:ComF family protein